MKVCREIENKYNISVRTVKNLLLSLDNNDKYFFHYRNLQLYISKEWSRKKLSSVDVWAILIAKIIYRL